MHEKFHIIGSLLRPKALLGYKEKIEHRDDISYPFYKDFDGYEACEDEAIKSVVQKQIDHGLTVISDGEYSKSLWHLDFVWGLQGIERYIADHGYFFCDTDGCSKYETRKDIGLKITGEIDAKQHHFIDIFKKLKQAAGSHQVKLCVPSPSHIYGELLWSDNIGGKDAVYSDSQTLKQGLIRAYKTFVYDYAEAGGEILQFDDCLWEIFADDNPNSPYTGEHINQEEVKALALDFIDINNIIIDFGHNLDLKMWTHNCRGNYDSRNMGGGSYEKIANLFLKQLKYDRFFLEWDDDRAGSIEALTVFQDKPNTDIVLGLLSSKTNTLDDATRALNLLEKAATIIDRDRLFLSHQCGFASCDGGNELTEAEQWAKIQQGQRLAEQFFGS
ncbi:5-methyltetrahydropteroyltriglutamate--homocysteine methyltransferase [Halolactibacillus alkaliphilus]|uniref:5-methyltetrahydropteroyltriglutamate--homocysteine methyltransferase n=1 Tax=Halolactibacillus alkaliphilus TaxID=442899 RepID=A0A511X4N1_9BACI|nr:cobalamin-independent methionine synthase II family protein [Halolactibacillus alkaliphilus]GEN57891.1 5-methyltetrahydropteroyltriglutamate--homocysteine methyltransferase [Halolactibacillus alkaliphilus]GGN75653.1 5-methyltetrahydropteroyltriglutamate--homocysteine methyltransferase [Halolactibacillus alkaliphilus]SFP08531.1 Methionine synthase II (cobalamin-independent) [Halolactibacillus alkaliphilus]